MGCHCLLPVTPEAAGSSPVDPANYPQKINAFPFAYGLAREDADEHAQRLIALILSSASLRSAS